MTTSFSELVALAKDRSLSGRRRMAVQFSDAYLTASAQFTHRERTIALEILTSVLADASLELRRELSQRLAREGGVPRKLIATLANDVIEVARPILQHSVDLESGELLNVIRHKTTAHRIAIANRHSIDDNVIEALTEKGEIDVARALLNNIAIHIPDSALRRMAAHALESGEIGEAIALRPELTTEIAEKIYWMVSNEIKAQIKSGFDLDGNKLDKVLQETVEQLARRQSNPATRRNIAQRLIASGRVDAPMLIDILKNRGTDLFKELLGNLTKFEPKVVEILCRTECSEPLALVCRALGFAKTETASLLMLVHDRIAGQTQFNPASLADALTTFARLTQGDAKTVMWQWQSDPGYLFSLAERRPQGDQADDAKETKSPE